MILLVCFTTFIFAVAAAQSSCMYHHDKTSPFYWKQGEDLCTDAICAEQGLDCVYPHEAINDAVIAHRITTGQDIWYEVDLLERSFNATFPDELFGSTADYKCRGICERPVTTLERLFHDYIERDIQGNIIHQSRELCFVIGPRMRYSPCSGKPCAIKGIAGSTPYHCVPNVQASQTVWLYCPGIMTECIKKTIDIPISCSCARFHCPTPIKPQTKGIGAPVGGLDSLFSGGLFGSPLPGSQPVKGIPAPVDLGIGGIDAIAKPVDIVNDGNPLDVNIGSVLQPGLSPADIKPVLPAHVASASDPLADAWNNGVSGQVSQSHLGPVEVFGTEKVNTGRMHKIV